MTAKMTNLICATLAALAVFSASGAGAATNDDATNVSSEERRVIYNHWQQRRKVEADKSTAEIVGDILFGPFTAFSGTVDAIALSPRLK